MTSELAAPKARRFARRRILLIAGSVVAALAVFIVVAVVTPIMAVRSIVVEGLERLDEPSVQAALADLQGRPLAQVTSEDVAARLSGFVLVQSYSIRAQPPSTLVVEIVERQAVGAIAGAGGHSIVDAAGVVLWVDPGVPADVPVLDLGGGDTASPAFVSATQVSLALPATFRAQVATVRARTADDVTLQLRDGTSVVWGSAEQSVRKVEVLLALVQATAGQDIAQYDVSSPEAPVTR